MYIKSQQNVLSCAEQAQNVHKSAKLIAHLPSTGAEIVEYFARRRVNLAQHAVERVELDLAVDQGLEEKRRKESC